VARQGEKRGEPCRHLSDEAEPSEIIKSENGNTKALDDAEVLRRFWGANGFIWTKKIVVFARWLGTTAWHFSLVSETRQPLVERLGT
jgi:hypothetical protein